ncbi:MAG: CvpA family protein [Desulfobacterales bacterium]|jgi:membrane protein required for colicin V production
MNPLDIVIIVILGFGLIRGFFRGLVKELSSIIGVIAGFFAANLYHPLLAPYFKSWISDPNYIQIISFALLFIAVFLVVSILGVIIKYLLNVAFLGWADRIFGVVFGLAKGVLIAAVLLMALTAFLPKNNAIVKDSLLAPHVSIITQKMAYLVPQEMKDNYRTKLKALQRKWNL